MGQKTHPVGFRLVVNKKWNSQWYASSADYGKLVHQDKFFRDYLKKKLYSTGIDKIEIERASDKVKINIHTSRPGLVIGKKGAGIEALRNELQRYTSDALVLNIKEVRKAELSACLVAENVALQLERRVAFRRAMKKSVQSTLKFGALGIKIRCAGRLGGAEMARKEWYREGRIPLHTLRADIDYGVALAKTQYGIIGVKTWIYKGETTDTK